MLFSSFRSSLLSLVLAALLICVVTVQGQTLVCPSNSSLVDVCSDCSCSVEEEEEEPAADPEENLALAFGVVTGAGLSTTIGAALVFSDRFFKLANNAVLGAALGFSGGVMFYVSMVEIFQKSIADFEACDCLWDGADEEESAAYIVATICFFSGVIFTYLIDLAVHKLTHCGGHGHTHGPIQFSSESARDDTGTHGIENDGKASANTSFDEIAIENKTEETEAKAESQSQSRPKSPSFDSVEAQEKKRLNHMGTMTAVAIGLHNFPEGLATFVATLADPAVGISLGVAIAIHNIPEGLCVSIPVYYATGSRWKGFCMAFWSGVTEIIGAALGYAFLKEVLGPAAYASLFGLVAGMMVTIVLKELLPTAHRYDPKDKYVTNFVFLGAAVMALSLVLFVI